MSDDHTLTQTAPPRSLKPDNRSYGRLVAYLMDGSVEATAVIGSLYVGRKGTNGLATRDPRSSGQHFRCRERRDTGEVVLEDLASRNGTAVNGTFVSEVILRDGDVIRAGDTVMVYEAPVRVGEDAPASASRASVRLTHELDHAIADARPILLTGETGTGKGYTAASYAKAVRPGGPFVTVNCASVPEQLFESELFGHKRGSFSGATSDKVGLVESARGGVIFLDELAEVSGAMQAKLLRAIETGMIRRVGGVKERAVDVVWVAATNADPAGEKLRKDLFYRLATPHIILPPLRTRRVDIVPLLGEMAGLSGHRALTPEALEALLVHPWPGNVRELVTLSHRLRRLPTPVDYTALPMEMGAFLAKRAGGTTKKSAPSREELESLFDQCDGNISKMSRQLGKHRTQVVRWLKAYGIGG